MLDCFLLSTAENDRESTAEKGLWYLKKSARGIFSLQNAVLSTNFGSTGRLHYFSAIHKVRAHASYMGVEAHRRAMKKILIILTICISTSVFGQQEPEVIAKYKDTARIGNFITRWYYDILGTSLVWKKSLTLYSDSTYRYVYQGGECGTFDEDTKGTWKKDGQLLILDNEITYKLVNNKLYWLESDPTNNRNVVMK